jgi:putative hydrolase of the HAD superfamily
MGVEAVVFDWGGTLSVWAEVDMEDMWRLAARHLAPEREDELTAKLLAVETASFARISVDQRATTLSSLLALASAESGLDVTEAVLEEAALHHLDSWTPHIRHDPQAHDVLSALRGRDRGLRFGLLSNTHWPRAFHEHFLERDGLDGLLDVRCYTSEMPFTKPHPSAFQTVLDGLGVSDPAKAVFVGDRRYDDVWGSQSFGMRGVWVRSPHTPPWEVEPDAVIDSLDELVPLIDKWAGQ